MQYLNIKIEESIATVEMCFNKRNTLTPENMNHLIESLEELDKKKDVHIILLTSHSEEYFSNGLDPIALKEEGVEACFLGMLDVILRLYPLRKPVIACIQGYAMAGGAVLSITADYRIISPTARFAFNEILLGLTMKQPLVDILKNTIGDFHAKRICQTGYSIKANKALEIGLADFQYESDEVKSKAFVFARKLARLDNDSLCHMKRMFRRRLINDWEKFDVEDNEAFIKASTSARFASTIEKLVKST